MAWATDCLVGDAPLRSSVVAIRSSRTLVEGPRPSARTRGRNDRDPDVVVVGAGPQGLAVAAHLRHAGVETLVVGEPMGFWKRHMPVGMFLRSLPRASSISDPTGSYHLARFEALRGSSSTPIPVDHYIEYGAWFQREVVPDIDPRVTVLLQRAHLFVELLRRRTGECVRWMNRVVTEDEGLSPGTLPRAREHGENGLRQIPLLPREAFFDLGPVSYQAP
jgi:hypothetical protein